jgi:1-aminocyclopropane-1-carboxylate deaminase/D-cysteine desulfhydrase-like pyridoxal-dependent ACC family enzyme
MLVGEWIVVAASDGMHHVMIIVATQQEEVKIEVLVGGTWLLDKNHNAQMALMDHTTTSALN